MKYLFIGGPPRSGTTALVKLLNRHPGIVLGIERYKLLYGDKTRRDQIGPDLFELERFLNIDPSETNIASSYYGPNGIEALGAKFVKAQYRGDKLPVIHRFIPLLNERLKATRYIFIFRDIERMCSSWNVRAEKENDIWPITHNYVVAEKYFNEMAVQLVRLKSQNPEQYLLVSYEKLFGPGGETCLVDLLASLKLRPNKYTLNYLADNVEKYTQIQEKPTIEPEGQKKFIQDNIDWENVAALQSMFI